MLDQFQELILDRYKNPQFGQKLENLTHSADGINQVCGDEVHLELRVEGDTIVAMGHQNRACAICSASADLLCEKLIGNILKEVNHISSEQVAELLGIPLSPTRLKCALLPLETIRLALKEA
jgi:nitrogen fixation NifU-like protein